MLITWGKMATEGEVIVTYEENTVTLTANVSDTVANLKVSIVQSDAFEVTENERLVLMSVGDGSGPLDDLVTLSSCGLHVNGVLRLQLVIMLEVRLHRGEGYANNIIIDMAHNDTISDLKMKLFEQHGMAVDTQHVKQSRITLNDTATLYSLRVHAHHVELELDVRFGLTLEVFTGVSFQLEVSSNERVDTLYAEVNRRARVPYHRQEMVYGDRVLEIGTRISDYGVPNRATLSVNRRNYQVMVFVKTLTGQTIMLTVTPRDTVAQVKAKIEEQEGIPINKQRLIFVGDQLQDDHHFLDYRIEHESAVHLVIREGDSFEVYVRAPSGRSHVFEVDPRETVDQLKTKLRDREGIPCDIQQFFYHDQLVETDRSLMDNNIISGSTLRLSIDQGRSTQIFISLQTRDTFSLWVSKSYTILRVKEMIAEKRGIASESQQLFFARTVLEDDRTLRDYTIETNHMLHVHVVYPPSLQFTVTLQEGSESRRIDCEEPANRSVQDLKCTLSDKVRAPATQQQLFFEGNELEGVCKLSECGIGDGCNLDLIISQPAVLATRGGENATGVLFVKTLTGKTIMVEVNSTDTVFALKEQIQAKEGVAVDHQCLVCGGKILDNLATVSDCGMQNQSVLHLVLRVPSQDTASVVGEN